MSSIGKQFISSNYGNTYTLSGVQDWTPTVTVASASYQVEHSTAATSIIVLSRTVESIGNLTDTTLAQAFTCYRGGVAITKAGAGLGTVNESGGLNILQGLIQSSNWQSDRVVFDGASGQITVSNGAVLGAFTYNFPDVAPYYVYEATIFLDSTLLYTQVRFNTPVVSGPLDAADFTYYQNGSPIAAVQSVVISESQIYVEVGDNVPETAPTHLVYTKNVPYYDDNGDEIPSFNIEVTA